jgi:hypothetical protein
VEVGRAARFRAVMMSLAGLRGVRQDG